MKQYLIITLLLLASIYTIFFFLDGPPPEVKFEVVERDRAYFEGEYFQGGARAPMLEELFITQRNRAVREKRKLIVVNFEADSLNGQIRQFIGVMVEKKPVQPRASHLEMPKGKYALTELPASALSKLDPKDIVDQASGFVRERSMALEPSISYEIYDTDEKLQVLFYLL